MNSGELEFSITYGHWSSLLNTFKALSEPAELQGLLLGSLCGQAQPSMTEWVSMAKEFMDVQPEPADAEDLSSLVLALEAMYELAQRAITDENYGLRLLLPEDECTLPQRIQSLSLWVQGFLYGVGSMGVDHEDKDGVIHETLEDLRQIAQADDEVEQVEENEVYYVQLVEYVRVLVLNMYALRPSKATAIDSLTPPKRD